MNSFLIKYFEITGFILGAIIGLSINWITDFMKINLTISICILVIGIGLFIYGFITKNKLISFEYNIKKGGSKRKKESIYNKTVRICKNNPMFQIKEGDDYGGFSEERTQVYPDKKGSGKYTIELITNGVIIKTLFRVYCDGGRISVPMPKKEVIENPSDLNNIEVKYYRDKNSIEFKIGKIIGDFYIYKNIEEIAKRSKIEIR